MLDKNIINFVNKIAAERYISAKFIYQSLGIDLEEEKRKIKEEIPKFLGIDVGKQDSWNEIQKIDNIPGIKSRYYSSSEPEFYGKFPKRELDEIKINDHEKKYWLFPKMKRISPSLINIPENPKILAQSPKKLKNGWEIVNEKDANVLVKPNRYDELAKSIGAKAKKFAKFALCKKCNYKNEYMDHDPEYICFNCR